jgi:uncharacterized protein (TIGR00369 family)
MWPTVAQRGDAAKPVARSGRCGRPAPRARADDGSRVVVEMPAAEFQHNPLGWVRARVISTRLDPARHRVGWAVHPTLAVGECYTSLDLTATFLRPVTADSGVLTCEGTVIQRGRRTALAPARLADASGRLVAHATSSWMIFS